MNKKIMIILSATIAVFAIAFVVRYLYKRSMAASIIDDEAAWDIRDASPQKKVIITKDGTVARYVREDDVSYVGDIQDSFVVPKEDAVVEIWYASDGKGIIFLTEPGTEPVFAAPDSLSKIVGELKHEEGYCPETYKINGFKDGWFSIETDGITGYVRGNRVTWDSIDSF